MAERRPQRAKIGVVPTSAELTIAIVGFSGFFALGVFAIVAPRRLSRFFRIAGGPLCGRRFAAKLFSAGRMRYTGALFVVATPFIAWGAIERILG
jgi:flagellar biosynthesis protein FlhB